MEKPMHKMDSQQVIKQTAKTPEAEWGQIFKTN